MIMKPDPLRVEYILGVNESSSIKDSKPLRQGGYVHEHTKWDAFRIHREQIGHIHRVNDTSAIRYLFANHQRSESQAPLPSHKIFESIYTAPLFTSTNASLGMNKGRILIVASGLIGPIRGGGGIATAHTALALALSKHFNVSILYYGGKKNFLASSTRKCSS
jgi:hypothetical protein